MTEQQARAEILEKMEEYYHCYHQTKAWDGHHVPYAGKVYDAAEMRNLTEAALDFQLTAGRFAQKFEEMFAAYLGVPFCAATTSGSSANLLAFMTLTSPLLGKRRIQRGDEVITVAAAFPTTVAPLMQFGAVPVFVDVKLPDANVDVTQLEKAYSKKTKAVILAHTLGMPFCVEEVVRFCKAHDLWLIEDNCDALGAAYLWEGKLQKTGAFGHLATASFYPPHHITMGEGGAVVTSDPLLAKILFSLRDWGRDCTCRPGEDNRCKHRFDRQFGELPFGYDHKYVYSHFGYNLKITEMQAAIGVAQLEKLPWLIEKRQAHFAKLSERMDALQDKVILPQSEKKSVPSPFGFLLTCREEGKREGITAALEESGIQTRVLFAGNLIRQPCFDTLRRNKKAYRTVGKLTVTDYVMRNSFWVGVFPGLSPEQLSYEGEMLYAAVKEA